MLIPSIKQCHTNQTWLDWLAPKRCLFCSAPGGEVCSHCLRGLPWLEHCCYQCALPLGHSHEVCAHCLKTPPAFRHCLSLWRYEFPLSKLIKNFKYQANTGARSFLQSQLSRAVSIHMQQEKLRFDAVICVPSHPLKRFTRGFNQAQLLCNKIAKHCNIPQLHALRKRQWHHSQLGLNRKERLKNLNASFELTAQVDGLELLLIDDVMTTASTANVISQLLLDNGAKSIDIACLARTPQHMSS